MKTAIAASLVFVGTVSAGEVQQQVKSLLNGQNLA
jgi:hypothetical protein